MRYPFIQQSSEEDCGAACLAMVAKYHGRRFTITHIREAVGTGQLGTTLLGLRRGAEGLGLQARPGKAPPEILDQLDQLPLPAIVHWKGIHWVVLYGKRRKRYVVADPSLGLRFLGREELLEGWNNGVVLLLTPGDIFYEQKSDRPAGFDRFWRRIWPHRGMVIQAAIYAQIIGLFSLANPFLIQVLTDDVLVRGDVDMLSTVALAVAALIMVSSFLSVVQYNLVANLAQRLELALTLEFARKLMRLPLSYFHARRSGEIVSRLDDVARINNLVSTVAVELPSRFFIAAISLGLMLFYSASLTVLSVIVSSFIMAAATVFLSPLQQRFSQVLALDAENQGVLVETFRGALTFKSMTAEPQLWEELQLRYGQLAHREYRTTQLGITSNRLSNLASSLGGVLLLFYGSRLVISNELSIGQLLAFNAMNANFIGLLGFGIDFIDEFAQVKTAILRFSEVIDAQEESAQDTQKAFASLAPDADIICKDISFSYPGRMSSLQDFSLMIPGGKATALVGRSGCGKSTLAGILVGLQSYEGNVRIGNYNIQDLATECLRQQVVLTSQEAHFWSRSILENFKMGSPYATFEEIINACQISQADEFIGQLPDGYQTVLGEFGSNISGGQRQRLAIARAIVNDPPVLILDESTSGLDSISEEQLLRQLLRHRQGKTTILISHRPSAIQMADWFVMIENGQVSIEGKPEDLSRVQGDHLSFLFGAPPFSNTPFSVPLSTSQANDNSALNTNAEVVDARVTQKAGLAASQLDTSRQPMLS